MLDAEERPNRIGLSCRFIERHMICVNNNPEAPTIPPMATNSGSEMARPAIAPDTPDNEFNSEMVMGISAPPTRRVNRIPKAAALNASRGIHPTKAFAVSIKIMITDSNRQIVDHS